MGNPNPDDFIRQLRPTETMQPISKVGDAAATAWLCQYHQPLLRRLILCFLDMMFFVGRGIEPDRDDHLVSANLTDWSCKELTLSGRMDRRS